MKALLAVLVAVACCSACSGSPSGPEDDAGTDAWSDKRFAMTHCPGASEEAGCFVPAIDCNSDAGGYVSYPCATAP